MTKKEKTKKPDIQTGEGSLAVGGNITKSNVQVGNGNIAVLGREAHVTIQQYFKGLSNEERSRQENQLCQSIFEKLSNLNALVGHRREIDNPFYSIEPLSYADRSLLFGQDDFLNNLCTRISSRPITFLTGNGGVGKTSLLQAGVVPELLKKGYFPILFSAGNLPLSQCIKEQFTDTDLARKMGLRSFLEFVVRELEPKQKVFIIIDRLEEFFNQAMEEQENFKTLLNILLDGLPNVHWLFSIHTGASYHLGFFEPNIETSVNLMTLSPLPRAAARVAILSLAKSKGIQIKEPLLEELLDQFGGDWVDPAQLQLICFEMAGGNGSLVTDWNYGYYESLGKVEGILQGYLENVINRFPPDERAPAWEILACLAEPKYTTNEQVFDKMISTYGVGKERSLKILELLRTKHLVDLETHYRLASTSLRVRVQEWLNRRSVQEKIHDEVVEQIQSIRSSALRGLIGGSIGFGLSYICIPYYSGTHIPQNQVALFLSFYIYFVALRALLGGAAGFVLTLTIDIIYASFTRKQQLLQLPLAIISGSVIIAILLTSHIYLKEIAAPQSLLSSTSATVFEGALWGAIVGIGAISCLEFPKRKWLILFVTSLISGFVLCLSNLQLNGLRLETPFSLYVVLAGFCLPFFLLGFSNLGKRPKILDGQ